MEDELPAEDSTEELMENDEVSPQEEAFMRGYEAEPEESEDDEDSDEDSDKDSSEVSDEPILE